MRLIGRSWPKVAALALLLVAAGVPVSSMAPEEAEAQQARRPNIILILTDDQELRSTSRMPKLRRELKAKGTTFAQAFATAPQCCPSRASFLTGKYVHNHTVFDNNEKRGGFRKFRASGEDRSTIATRLNGAGYETILIGKYLNWYQGKYIPPGWDEWNGQMGRNNDHRYNRNGKTKFYDPDRFHDTDLFSDWATGYVRQEARKKRPFFMYLSVNAPHGPAIPAKRHERKFSNIKLPRPPSFNEADVSDKPNRVRSLSRLSDRKIRNMTRFYRDRQRSLLSVDDMIGRLVTELRKSGELDNTYIVFTSDHGYHMGQHRLRSGKTKPYEEDIRIPMFVRGPGVPRGRTLQHKVINADFAPTFAQLGGARVPASVDGRSFVPLLRGSAPPVNAWRESLLVEFAKANAPRDSGVNFAALRTNRYSYVEYGNGDRELYDLAADPYQLRSLHESPQQQALIDDLSARLRALKNCSGQASCRTAENGAPTQQ